MDDVMDLDLPDVTPSDSPSLVEPDDPDLIMILGVPVGEAALHSITHLSEPHHAYHLGESVLSASLVGYDRCALGSTDSSGCIFVVPICKDSILVNCTGNGQPRYDICGIVKSRFENDSFSCQLYRKPLFGAVGGFESEIFNAETGETLARLKRGASMNRSVFACTYCSWNHMYCHVGTSGAYIDCFDLEGSIGVFDSEEDSVLQPAIIIDPRHRNNTFSIDRDERLKYVVTASAGHCCKLFDLTSPDSCIGCITPGRHYSQWVLVSEDESALYVCQQKGEVSKFDVRMITNRKVDGGYAYVPNSSRHEGSAIWTTQMLLSAFYCSIDQVNPDTFVASGSSRVVLFRRDGKIIDQLQNSGFSRSVAVGGYLLRSHSVLEDEFVEERLAFLAEIAHLQCIELVAGVCLFVPRCALEEL